MTSTCTHLDTVHYIRTPGGIAGCLDCLAIGAEWVHLRMCQSCGHIACCDDSPNRHAAAHAFDTGHPIIRSAEPRETWSYCYVDDVALDLTDHRSD
jgi:hypothetical protein